MKTQKAAQTSLEWFENSARYLGQEPLQFTFNLMTRSKQITYDNLHDRDPKLVQRVTDWYTDQVGAPETRVREIGSASLYALFVTRPQTRKPGRCESDVSVLGRSTGLPTTGISSTSVVVLSGEPDS